MIAAITGLLVCQLAGEILVRSLALPLPGPVVGLGLMFGFLVWRGRSHEPAVPVELGNVVDALLANLSLLFVPAAVGVVRYLALLRQYAGPIALTIAGSTLIAMVATAVTFRLVARMHTFRHKSPLADVEAAVDPEHHP